MTDIYPQREIDYQRKLLQALQIVLEHAPLNHPAVAEPLRRERDWINAEFAADMRARAALMQLTLPADLRRIDVEPLILGRCLRRAAEIALTDTTSEENHNA